MVPSGDLNDEVRQSILEYEISKLRLLRDPENGGSHNSLEKDYSDLWLVLSISVNFARLFISIVKLEVEKDKESDKL